MKNEIIKVKLVKLAQEKLSKFYLQVITDTCVKIAVFEICSEKETRESAFGTFKCTVAFTFAIFCQQIFEKKKKNSEGIFGKIDQKLLP